MSSKFSGALQLTDLDDFIGPSQECIKPTQVKKSEGVRLNKTSKKRSKIKLADDGTYTEVSESSSEPVKTLVKAEVSLSDCLACSGCVTSAETVLVQQHSHEELYKVLSANKESSDKKYVVVSVSPQSRASFAAHFNMPTTDTAKVITKFFGKIGAQLVLDTAYFHQISLSECSNEFLNCYHHDKAKLPLLTSACPGWICYAEKTHGSLIVPHLSSVKSAQQIAGSLIKTRISSLNAASPSSVYHVTVMPCYDKKLEASREDFYNDIYSSKDVDLVLTTTEVLAMMENESLNVSDLLLEETEPDVEVSAAHKEFSDALLTSGKLFNNSGGGSGGYLEYVFKSAAKELFDREVENLDYKVVRNNKDFQEVLLRDDDGNVLLHFACAYGFRSIQNLVQKMKRKNCKYHYVEVMACPSGCLNGGGQIKDISTQNREVLKEHLAKIQEKYDEIEPADTDLSKSISLSLKYSDTELINMLHTKFHALQTENSAPLGMKW